MEIRSRFQITIITVFHCKGTYTKRSQLIQEDIACEIWSLFIQVAILLCVMVLLS